jgi:1,4-dihydroxy-2-naphthoate octaprenyltransferase
MVFFGWLLALLASADAVATTQFVDSRNLTMAVILAAFAILWHVLLWRNIRRVESDIKALLSRT